MHKIYFLSVVISLFFSPFVNSQIDYKPLSDGEWKISTPSEQNLDTKLLDNFYKDASELKTLYSLLVIKNGYLISEKYFNEGSIDQKTKIASVTKSFTSAFVGLALEQGYLKNLDQNMLDYFPELEEKITDPRKYEITIRHLLQMRAGYPWEEMKNEHLNILLTGFKFHHINDIPLTKDPGQGFQYSNFSSYLLGVLTSRAVGTDLKSFARNNLFIPLNAEIGEWMIGWEGYYLGFAEMNFNARDLAKFGLLYLNDGKYNGKQIIPAKWVNESLQNYSPDAWISKDQNNRNAGRYFKELGYGYQWWSSTIGDYTFDFAWGHGGQLVVLLEDLNIVIVTTADPLYMEHNAEAWKKEKTILNTVGRFILSLSQPDNMPPKIELNEAVVTGNLESVKEHINYGSDLNERDIFGSTPLIIAATFGNYDVVSALIDAGVELNAKNNEGSTALFTAAFFGRKDIVKILLDNGANKTIRNNSGANALDVVNMPFEIVKRFYDYFIETLGPAGLSLDYEEIKKDRTLIAEMLK